MNRLLGRAVLSFLVLPGTVAFLVPWLLLEPAAPGLFFPLGLIPLALGIVLLLWCVRDFYVAGKGTLAPWDPPQELVVTGLYRFSRNPIYIAVLLVLWGWALGFRSQSLAIYALAVMVAFHLRVVFGEEPWLARTHGEAWVRYKAQVPRWVLALLHMVVTHAMNAPILMDVPQMQQAARQGAFIEFVGGSLTTSDAAARIDRFADAIRKVGPQFCILSSDLGQKGNALPPDGLAAFIEALHAKGFTDAELDRMSKQNPARLLGLP